MANQSKTIRLPVHLVDKIAKIRRVASALAEELQREPTDEELAMEMGMSVNKIAHLKTVSVRPTSLDAPVGEDESTSFGELVGDEEATTPYENLHTKSLSDDMNEIIDGLDERESAIIRMRFGLNGDRPMTLEEVGQEFDITRERVRQLQNIALKKLRNNMHDKEEQRTVEEIHEEKVKAKRMEVLKDFFERKVEPKLDCDS